MASNTYHSQQFIIFLSLLDPPEVPDRSWSLNAMVNLLMVQICDINGRIGGFSSYRIR